VNTWEASRFHVESELLPCHRAFLASSVQPLEKDFCALSHEETYTFHMEVGNMGRFASAENLVSQCSRFLLNANQAKDIVSDMEVCVRESWHACAKKAGVSENDCNRIAPAFVYPGFRNAVPAEE